MCLRSCWLLVVIRMLCIRISGLPLLVYHVDFASCTINLDYEFFSRALALSSSNSSTHEHWYLSRLPMSLWYYFATSSHRIILAPSVIRYPAIYFLTLHLCRAFHRRIHASTSTITLQKSLITTHCTRRSALRWPKRSTFDKLVIAADHPNKPPALCHDSL